MMPPTGFGFITLPVAGNNISHFFESEFGERLFQNLAWTAFQEVNFLAGNFTLQTRNWYSPEHRTYYQLTLNRTS
jgi:hypothetical protein